MARNYEKPSTIHGTPDELLAWSKECKNNKESRRFLCIRYLMIEGGEITLKQATVAYGVDVRTVRNWVRAWNKDGKEGLKIIPQPGRPGKFTSNVKKTL